MHLHKPYNKYVFCCIICSVFLCLGCKKDSTSSNTTPTTTAYKLVWAEEFNYTGLPDSTYWGYETGFVRNHEVQNYVASNKQNSYVDNGVLTITATNNTALANPVSSASIITKDKMNVLYGKIEVRAKMPKGNGSWPAIWTEGQNRATVGWPACGEIDIVEWLGNVPTYIFGSVHKADSQNKDNPLIGPYTPAVLDMSDNYHIYSIEWDSTSIKYYYDNINYVTYTASQMTASEWAQFTKPHFILLNLALGGDSGGTIDYTKFPFTFTVDYVRYYKKQ
jgi:beta-glucanase (GH16 family)